MATATNKPDVNLIDELCQWIDGKSARGPVLLSDLPEKFNSPSLLAVADKHGLLEFGRRESSSYGDWKWKLKENGDPNPGGNCMPDTKTTERTIHVHETWDWTSLAWQADGKARPAQQCKSMAEVLLEDSAQENKKLKLHIRLTAKGQERLLAAVA